jgi:hypothetical protein
MFAQETSTRIHHLYEKTAAPIDPCLFVLCLQ